MHCRPSCYQVLLLSSSGGGMHALYSISRGTQQLNSFMHSSSSNGRHAFIGIDTGHLAVIGCLHWKCRSTDQFHTFISSAGMQAR
jgi:hypothetical protein